MPKKRITAYTAKNVFALTIGTKLYSKSTLQVPYLRRYFQHSNTKYELDMGVVTDLFPADPDYRTWVITRGDTLVEQNIYTLFEVRSLLLIGLPVFLNQELTSPVNFHFYVDRMIVYVVNGKVANFESAFNENDSRVNNPAKIWIVQDEDGESIILYTDASIYELVIGVRMFSDEGLLYSPGIYSFIFGSYTYIFSGNMIAQILDSQSFQPTNDFSYRILTAWTDSNPERETYYIPTNDNKVLHEDKELSTPASFPYDPINPVITIKFIEGNQSQAYDLVINEENAIPTINEQNIYDIPSDNSENVQPITDSITNETVWKGSDGYIYTDENQTSRVSGPVSIAGGDDNQYFINQQPDQPPVFLSEDDTVPNWSNAYAPQSEEQDGGGGGDNYSTPTYTKTLNKRVNWYEDMSPEERNEPHWEGRINGRPVGNEGNQAYWRQHPPVTINGQNYGGNG
jgi:hypothetical protein